MWHTFIHSKRSHIFACFTHFFSCFGLHFYCIMAENIPPGNISNTPRKKSKKRLSDGSAKVYNWKTKPRKTIDIYFDSEAKKLAFEENLKKVKEDLDEQSSGAVFSLLLDNYHGTENKQMQTSNISKKPTHVPDTSEECKVPPFLFTNNESFVCSKMKFLEFLDILHTGTFQMLEYHKVGHVCEATFVNTVNNAQVMWHSSSPMGSDFEVNCKLVFSYLCSGMLETQYEKFCSFANVGLPSKRLRKRVVTMLGRVAEEEKDKSIEEALQEEVSRTEAGDRLGISVMSDARHACRKNSFHSDIVTLGQVTHKVVNYQHVTKQDDRISQRHELHGTRKLYEDMDAQHIKIRAHVHDRNASISKFLVQERPRTIDACDTWHAGKEVRRATSKIVKGARRNIGVTWHPQLADKASGIKTHSFWAIKHCEGDEGTLLRYLDNIVQHYRGNHAACHHTSRCQQPGYIPSRLIVTDNDAVRILSTCIQSLIMYKQPAKYKFCMDTHYVECFNNTVLVYVDKRIHYRNLMYKLRLSMAILDWNEHTSRPVSSVQYYMSTQNPRRQLPKRVLKPKTFVFVSVLWNRLQEAAEALGQGDDGGNDQEDNEGANEGEDEEAELLAWQSDGDENDSVVN